MKLIDLTKTLDNGTAVYPHDPKIALEPFYTYEKNGCSLTKITLGSHSATHADAPSHFIAGGKNIDALEPEHFIGKALCKNAPVITADFLKETVSEQNGEKILLLRTGCEGLDKFPSFPPETAEILSSAGIITLGIDSPSLEPSAQIHKSLLSKEIVIIEGLCNLLHLCEKSFFLTALPMKLSCDGAPVRAYAILD